MATVEEIFLAALEKAPAERAAYLDAACGADADLRAQVEALLRSHEEAGSLLEQPLFQPGQTVTQPPAAEQSGMVIGPYKLIEQIGEGGMGTVWMAQQTEPVKRLVAVKLIKAGMDSKAVIARFEAERQALALMDHPNIAKVFDGGTTGLEAETQRGGTHDAPRCASATSGRPYFVMELVKGVPITKYCDEHRLTPRQRLELFIPVCQAIQHAHQKGIIHRDLKPSNVLVALYDGKPVPKVIDFGVAKAAGQQLTEKTLVTGFGALVGTLEYMSPEQAEVNQLDIDTRSDIYSLGVLLYELLAGSTPFSKKDLEKAGMLEMLRVIREQEPSKPSTKLSSSEALPTLSANRGTEPAKLTKLVRGELDWIVMKALEKDRNRRYETANGFAMDVQRYLADEAVLACPPSAWYRFRKFARRRRTALLLAAGVLLALAGIAGGIGWNLYVQAGRHTKTVAEVTASLKEATQAREVGRWPEAFEAARRARSLLDAGGGDLRLGQQLEELEADLRMLDKLEDIHASPPQTWLGGPDHAWVDSAYQEAFRNYGLDLTAMSPKDAAEGLRIRGIRIELAAAIDDWAINRKRAARRGEQSWKDLLAVARAGDADPWRNQVRNALERGDKEALKAVAASPQAIDQPAISLILLADALQETGAGAEGDLLLRRAQRRYPGHYWVNFRLAQRLRWNPAQLEEATRFCTAALAVRPRNAATYTELADIFSQKGALDEALAAYQDAIRLPGDPGLLARAHNNLGLVLGNMGRHEEALAAFREYIRLSPDGGLWFGVHENLGVALRILGKLDEAIAEFRKAVELNPKHAGSLYNLANALSEQGKLNEAIVAWHKANELDPSNCGHLAQLCVASGRLRDGLDFLNKAIERQPKEFGYWWERGELYSRLGLWDLAAADFRQAFQFSAPSSQHVWICHAISLVYVGDGEGYRRLSTQLPQHFKQKPGGNALARALTLAPAPDIDLVRAAEQAEFAIRNEPGPWSHNALGLVHYRAGNYQLALDPPQVALRLDNNWRYAITSHSVLAMTYHHLDRPDQARKALRDAAQKVDQWQQSLLGPSLDMGGTWWDVLEGLVLYREAKLLLEGSPPPDDPRPIIVRARAFAALGDHGKADESCGRAMELGGKNLAVRLACARVRASLGLWDKVAAGLREGIEPAADKTVLADCHYLRATAHVRLRRFAEAVADYTKTLELAADRPVVLNDLAWLLATCPEPKFRDPQRAVELTKIAVQLAPKEGSIWNTLGAAHYRAGSWRAAVAALENSLKLQGDNSFDFFFLAMTHWQLGAKDEARKWYDKGVQWMEKNAKGNDELRRFRREAEELLEIKKK